jgi:hypothetical protein
MSTKQPTLVPTPKPMTDDEKLKAFVERMTDQDVFKLMKLLSKRDLTVTCDCGSQRLIEIEPCWNCGY